MKNPQHVGLIIDGNRRFAKRLMMKPFMGHEWGAKKIEQLFDWCKELDIKELTLFTFSVENFNRPKKEFDYLMDLFEREFEKNKDDKRIYENKIKIRFIGRLWMFPEKVQEKMRVLMEKTKEHNDFIINFAMAYGGRAEILDAAKRIAEKIEKGELKSGEVDEKVFREHLYLDSDPDLIIRTGESRLSGFLLWQSSYSELIFLTNILWPEFSKEHFINCIAEYKKRQRRFGK